MWWWWWWLVIVGVIVGSACSVEGIWFCIVILGCDIIGCRGAIGGGGSTVVAVVHPLRHVFISVLIRCSRT